MKVTPTPQNNVQLALDIRRGQWLVSDAEALLPIALDFLAHISPHLDALDFETKAYSEDGASFGLGDEPDRKKKCVAVIPVRGTLTKYDTCFSIGTMTIASQLIRSAADDNVVGVVLDVDSGGGACNAVPIMIEAIQKVKSAGKPIVAHCDFCASAAYWISSQCDSIFVDNALSAVGSIGVMTQIVDSSNLRSGEKIITVYAKESSDKNLAYRKALEGDLELLQSEMSPIVQQFQNAVKKGRKNLQSDTPGVLSGAMFYAAKAREIGLIDNIMTLDQVVENVFVRAEYR